MTHFWSPAFRCITSGRWPYRGLCAGGVCLSDRLCLDVLPPAGREEAQEPTIQVHSHAQRHQHIPRNLSNKKKIIKVRRDKDGPGREGGRGNLLVDAEAGLLGQDKSPKGPSSGSCIDQLPIKVDYGEELRSPIASLTPRGEQNHLPSSPEEDVMLGSLTSQWTITSRKKPWW